MAPKGHLFNRQTVYLTVHYEMRRIRLHISETLAGLWSPVDNCHRIQYYKLRIGTSLKNQMAAGGTYETYSFHEQAQKRFTMKCATFACTLVSHWLESSRQLSSHTILQTAKVDPRLVPVCTLTLGLSSDSQVRCQSWKFVTLSVKTPSVSSLRKYYNSTLTVILK